jgi:phosphatidylinositol-3-phosphatase
MRAATAARSLLSEALSAPASTYEHVVWIVMENHSFDDIIGSSDAPYINQLADQHGLAASIYAEAHPSLPNYIATTSGSTQGVADDDDPSSHPLDVPSLFSLLPGGGSRSLLESMPGKCSRSDAGDYAVRHNPRLLGAAATAADMRSPFNL